MIASFGDRATEDLYHEHFSRQAKRLPANLRAAMLRKLDMIQAARMLLDLRGRPETDSRL